VAAVAGNSNSGRKPKATHLKLVKGTARPSRLNPKEPAASGDLVDPPAHFDDRQRDAWKYAIDHAPKGVLKKIDLSVLAVWVVSWVMHQRATEALQSGPHVLKTPNGAAQQSPWVGILNTSAKNLRAAASDLGFSPSARTRISGEEGGEDDAATEFFGRA
jgi:P27 family predicted phage terminase small subunit